MEWHIQKVNKIEKKREKSGTSKYQLDIYKEINISWWSRDKRNSRDKSTEEARKNMGPTGRQKILIQCKQGEQWNSNLPPKCKSKTPSVSSPNIMSTNSGTLQADINF